MLASFATEMPLRGTWTHDDFAGEADIRPEYVLPDSRGE